MGDWGEEEIRRSRVPGSQGLFWVHDDRGARLPLSPRRDTLTMPELQVRQMLAPSAMEPSTRCEHVHE